VREREAERGRSGKSVALRDIKPSSFKKQACCLLLPWFRTQGTLQKVDIAVYLLTLANVLGSSYVYARFFKKRGRMQEVPVDAKHILNHRLFQSRWLCQVDF
jgi:hypothetical protein